MHKNWTDSDLERLAKKAPNASVADAIRCGGLDAIRDGDVVYVRPGLDPSKAAARIVTKTALTSPLPAPSSVNGSARPVAPAPAAPAPVAERTALEIWRSLDEGDAEAPARDYGWAERAEAETVRREAVERARAEEERLRKGERLTPGEIASRQFNDL